MNRQCLANSCVSKKLAARWRAESQLFAPNCERLGRGTADDLVESINPTAVPGDVWGWRLTTGVSRLAFLALFSVGVNTLPHRRSRPNPRSSASARAGRNGPLSVVVRSATCGAATSARVFHVSTATNSWPLRHPRSRATGQPTRLSSAGQAISVPARSMLFWEPH